MAGFVNCVDIEIVKYYIVNYLTIGRSVASGRRGSKDKESHLAGFSVRKPFTVLVAVVIIFALGFTSFRSMTPELLPNIELPYVITITSYPGATSEKVETEVTKPLEASFATLEGLKSISSQSRSNVSTVMLEFTDGASLDAVSLDMLQRISQLEGGWDDLVGTPIIIKMNPSMLPVMIAAVECEGMDTKELSRFMDETVQTKLEGIEGVASLDVSGMRMEQVNVVVHADKVAEVNKRISRAVERELDKRAQDLEETKADLQGKLDDLKSKSTELEDGVDQLAEKMGDGSAKLGEGWAQWGIALTSLNDLKALLQSLKDSLADLLQQQDDSIAAALDELVANAVAAAEAEWQASNPGVPFPPEMADAVAEQVLAAYGDQVTAAVKEGFAPYINQIKDGIAQTEAGIKAMEGAGKKLAQAQGMLDTASISAQFQLSNAAAQLAAAQGQISAGIMQIEMGLDQLDDARESALEQADISSMITMDMISMILKAQNFAMPAGYVKQGNTDYLVKVGDEVGSLDELKDMVLMDMGMDDLLPIRLSDVAEVFMSDNLTDIYAKINGNDGVLLSFSKQSERSTTVVADAILAKFGELSKQYTGLKFTPLMNQGDYIYRVTNSIISDLLWGALFAVIILLLFLRDLRPTFITLCSIPISLVFALVAMYFAGVTINIISLGGLAIAVGRLVDDSVVVIENIFRLRAKGYSPVKAAVTGASQVAGAIVASTLTTICVFLPIVFVEGLTRQLFTDFGLTFAFALLASLAIAMSLVPAMASGMFRTMEPKEHRFMDRLIAVYDRALLWTLRYKPVVLIAVVVLLGASGFAIYNKGFAYMPEGSSGQLAVSLTMPKDSTQEQRRERADEAMSRITDIEGVDTVGMISGNTGSALSFLIGSGGSGMRSVTSYILLDEGADTAQISSEIDSALQDIDMEVSISDAGGMNASALGGSGISIEIYGDDPDALMEAAGIISEAVSVVEGVDEVDDGLEEATPELNFVVDRAKASEYGLTTAQVYQRVAAALAGERSATQVTWKTNSYDVVVVNEYSGDDGLTPDYVKDLSFKVTQRDGSVEDVKLMDIATIRESQAMPTVLRSEQRRYMPVSVSIDEDHNITLMTQEVESVVADLKLPAGVTYEITGESATIMDAFKQLGLMLILGLLLVYLIMVAQFQSLKSPFIIMFTIPLAFTGGFIALLLTNMILSVISLIGFAMLVGIIVSNAIVLVDYINRLRLEGMERVAAIREGAATRMRPILMTALATIFALLVMALGIGRGTNMMQPLAIVCIGGLAYGTFMTLFVIPIIYDAFNKKELRKIDTEDLIVDRDA